MRFRRHRPLRRLDHCCRPVVQLTLSYGSSSGSSPSSSGLSARRKDRHVALEVRHDGESVGKLTRILSTVTWKFTPLLPNPTATLSARREVLRGRPPSASRASCRHSSLLPKCSKPRGCVRLSHSAKRLRRPRRGRHAKARSLSDRTWETPKGRMIVAQSQGAEFNSVKGHKSRQVYIRSPARRARKSRRTARGSRTQDGWRIAHAHNTTIAYDRAKKDNQVCSGSRASV
ncbi:hypothetical protein GA0061098_10792 [Bradyrhizobium shewense]|uniref:Uncharacterized protein n=1 Tax=Bradyrhizobium shewense TaxID=1761772 RepID=A0A1C3XV45_9BRAD|nr:hypothetical protein GA0061098_10792 [Bradyrhizobium shewense]